MARCNVCGDLLAPSLAAFGDALCPVCAVEGPSFARAVHYGAYSGVLRRLIHLLKYERVRPAAAVLGRLTAEACLQLEGDLDVSELVLIPVPAHKARMRSRGFNQAELIARAARRGIEEATGRRMRLETTALLRVRFAESQVGLTAAERRKQVRGAFKVSARGRVKGREILLVDDVLTTGATASECARELLEAGASQVWVATPARALGEAAHHHDTQPKQGVRVDLFPAKLGSSAMAARLASSTRSAAPQRGGGLNFDFLPPGLPPADAAHDASRPRREWRATEGRRRIGRLRMGASLL